ncbi:hypothetical protein DSO57_1018296 [Entomophthora muscae]|uniref:Uncharacterized protein n=1 Tax=Entomophthora muscae TaxID=34485 RepID=A0ACC2UDP4_9FUNG|nr:hypothetical protein DSO57_1018296 [Entomophthora muscae]
MNGASNLAFKRGPRARACDTCRRWKKRCDQSKPACTRCTDSGTECTYSYVQVYYQYEAQTASLRQEASRRHGFIVNLAPCHGIQLAPPLNSPIGDSNMRLPPLSSLFLPTGPSSRKNSTLRLDVPPQGYIHSGPSSASLPTIPSEPSPTSGLGSTGRTSPIILPPVTSQDQAYYSPTFPPDAHYYD